MKSGKRYLILAGIVILAACAVVSYSVYQARQANLKAAEGFQKQAEMLEKLRGK